ncbi:MAG: helix-turn-helix domain-containing protein [Candidatus Atribacteria bacterium]|nr:helix-turn-helix domain-containing protein [Candidatus Atribacteria bacterium]MCD6349253.1 helix-turn-helix domain-containing protein [Candidatus Atribacteria bacterium]
MREEMLEPKISPRGKGAFKMQTFVKISHDTVLHLGEVATREKCAFLLPIYVALLFHVNKKGRCFPSYQRIKEVSGIRSNASVRKALLLLEKYGFIKKQSRHGRHGNNTYQISKFHEMKNECGSKFHEVKNSSSRREQLKFTR